MDTTVPAPQAHPLRPYYVPSPDGAFGSHTKPSSGSITHTSAGSGSGSRSGAAPPSLRLKTSTKYDSVTAGLGDLDGQPQAGTMLRAFVTSSLLSFTSTALVMPFEVGKTLAQVQWVPKDGLDPSAWKSGNEEDAEEEAVETRADIVRGQLEDEAEVDAYFSDLQARGLSAFAPPGASERRRPTSPSGYLKRSGVQDEAAGTKPEWIMPVVVQGGVWEMMRTVGKWKGEGWSSLWKGQLTTCVLDAVSTTMQPLLLSALSVALLPSSKLASYAALPLIHVPHPTPLLLASTFSHALTTLFLSPFDLIRTRLIVQSAQPQHRKYAGPLDAFRTIIDEEGGLWTAYLHPNLLFPALLEGIARPLIHLSTPLIISRLLGIEPSASPITFGLAEFVVGSLGLLVTIPIETVRKRLQIQTRAEFVRGGRPGGTGRAWRTCVETRPASYAGIVECVYRILTEETGRIPRRRRRSQAERERERQAAGERPDREDLSQVGLGSGGGLKQLYRGLSMGVGANFVVFLLGLVAGGDDVSGWAEV